MDIGRAVLVQMESQTRLDFGTWGTMGVGLGYQLPVVVIVFNNGGVYGGDRTPEEITFGGKGYLVETPDELRCALTESFSAKKPAVINVTIDPYAGSESGSMQHKNGGRQQRYSLQFILIDVFIFLCQSSP
ncbi:lyase [Lithospermum erythrorhizon]|uniref:Lyase n=1 Tax=Lithospermum erythrorhizon TaxID=34254 RepID=A0AAV3PP56_LITER